MDKLKSYLPTALMILGGIVFMFGGRIQEMLPDRWTIPVPFVQPNVDGAWVIIVEETSERTPEIISIATDADYWKTIETRGMKWRFYDDDSDDASEYVTMLAGQIPGLVILGPDGKKLLAEKLPSTTQEIDKAIKRVTGK